MTPSQTVGPFFHPAMLRADGERRTLTDEGTSGERIRIEGRALDGEGNPVPDALVEIWQADADGRYHHPRDARGSSFIGFGRAGTDDDGAFWFETIKPGRVPFDAERRQAPHLLVTIFARGLLNHLVTRLYFAGDPANEDDPILRLIPDERRETVIARPDSFASNRFRFDIILQGIGETAFFDL